MSVNVTIDREECTSCESCWIIEPGFFEQNPADNWSQVVEKYRAGGDPATGAGPDDMRDKIQEAADSCPVQIIHVS